MSFFSRPALLTAGATLIIAITLFSLTKKQTNPGPRVALLVPAVHPSMHQIEEGFITTLKKELPQVMVDTYNANGDKVLMKGQAEKITADNYDLIMTIGTNASQLTKTALTKKGKRTPLLFSAVSDPVQQGILNAQDPKDQVSGIIDQYNQEDQINMLLLVKPDIKNVLLVYDPASNPSFENEKEKLQKAFAKRGITLSAVAVFALKDIQQKVPALLHNIDVIMTLTDHTVCSAIDSLIKLCNQEGITLFTSELDSNDKGAALSYGVHESEYGVENARKAIEILGKKVPVNALAITSLNNFFLKVNTSTAPLQKVTISSDLTAHPRVLLNGKDVL